MASVQQHKSRWRVKWYANGRALYESFATKREAENAARRIEARTLLDGRAPDVASDDAVTLAQWWARWEPGRPWRTSSRQSHGAHFRRYIGPVFGRVPLERITVADVRRFHRALEARGLAPATVGHIHTTLSMCLQGAVDDQLLVRNPARATRLRRPARTTPTALDAAQVSHLLDAIAATTPALVTFARLLATTGLRRSEAAGLCWPQVDLDAGVLTIDRQLDYSASTQPTWSPTKTGRTRRVLLTESMVEELRAHRVAQSVRAIRGDGLVFIGPDGGPWGRTTLHDRWTVARRHLEAKGHPLPPGAWHLLRHTVASRLLEAGLPPVEIAEMLGHSPAMLLSTYGHVTDRAAADARLRAALDA